MFGKVLNVVLHQYKQVKKGEYTKSWKLGSYQKNYHPTRMIVKRNLQITVFTNL